MIPITPEVFVVTWQMSESKEECQRVLSEFAGQPISWEYIRVRAAAYRQAGVKLKSFSLSEKLELAGLGGY